MDELNALPPDRAPARPSGTSGARGKTLAVVPLALLSAAWTTHLAGFGATAPLSAAAATTSTTTPDTTATPSEVALPVVPVEVPASLSNPEVTSATDGSSVATVADTSTSALGDIPSAALAAYQRAETVINTADTTCHLSWQLVAAVGRVESDHGRFAGSSIGTDGVARPAILGPVLDGSNGTSLIADTDAGQYDGDLAFDRAVGPMQFIPSTWSVVGVDADNDGVRDPQDVDDAALAAAVYLCSGTEDLADAVGQSAAVFRYNHSQAYVDTVLSIMNGYLDGDFATVPGPTVSAGSIVPLYPVTQVDDVPIIGPVVAPDEAAAKLDLPDPPDQHGEALELPPVVPIHHPDEPTGPLDPLDPVDPADPVDPTVPADPTDGGEPLPEVPTDDPTSEPGDEALPVEPSEEALLSCAAVYVDDLALEDDDFDLCVVAFDEAVAAAEPGVDPLYPVPLVTPPATEPTATPAP